MAAGQRPRSFRRRGQGVKLVHLHSLAARAAPHNSRQMVQGQAEIPHSRPVTQVRPDILRSDGYPRNRREHRAC